MIQVNNLSYAISGKPLLHDVSVSFGPGMIHLVIGPNGAGKSTLVKVLAGLLHPTSGTVSYEGKPLNSYSVGEQARMRAVLSQHMELSFPMSVRELVMMGRYPHFTGKATGKDEAVCDEAISFFEVAALAERDYTTLSGGEKQRVQFARTLAQIWHPEPGHHRYLLLDEPLTFLDVHYQHQFMQQIKGLAEAKDLVIVGVVHDLNLALKYADTITLLHQGTVLASGAANDVVNTANIRTAYHIEPTLTELNGQRFVLF